MELNESIGYKRNDNETNLNEIFNSPLIRKKKLYIIKKRLV